MQRRGNAPEQRDGAAEQHAADFVRFASKKRLKLTLNGKGTHMIEAIIRQHPGQVCRIDKFKCQNPLAMNLFKKCASLMNSLRLCPALDKTSYSSKQAVPVSLILSLWSYGRALTRLMPQSRP